jgi:hypothetical protein
VLGCDLGLEALIMDLVLPVSMLGVLLTDAATKHGCGRCMKSCTEDPRVANLRPHNFADAGFFRIVQVNRCSASTLRARTIYSNFSSLFIDFHITRSPTLLALLLSCGTFLRHSLANRINVFAGRGISSAISRTLSNVSKVGEDKYVCYVLQDTLPSAAASGEFVACVEY